MAPRVPTRALAPAACSQPKPDSFKKPSIAGRLRGLLLSRPAIEGFSAQRLTQRGDLFCGISEQRIANLPRELEASNGSNGL
jgi:hypothetical protein